MSSSSSEDEQKTPAVKKNVKNEGNKRKMKVRKIQHNKRMSRGRRKSVDDEKTWE